MVTTLKEQILEKLEEVPDSELSKVMDFLEFLTWKAQQTQMPEAQSISASNSIQRG